MIRLSERMEHIVNLAKPEKGNGSPFACAAEAGCDHAYITMELIKRGYVLSGIAMDVKSGPLLHAERNIEAEFKNTPYEGRAAVRLSDGLAKLRPGEADLLVIAGMGGGLICRILQEKKDIALNIPVWILQPQSECREVRKYLYSCNRMITAEDMVFEDGKFYPMFRVEENKNTAVHSKSAEDWKGTGNEESIGNGEDELFLEYGPLLLKQSHPCLLKYLLWKENTNRKIYKALNAGNSPKAALRKKELEIEFLKIQSAKEFF